MSYPDLHASDLHASDPRAQGPSSPVTAALARGPLLFDGAAGTFLQARGLAPGELPETWNLSHPDRIREMHRAYAEAGCDILTANTFGANSLKFSEEETARLVRAGIELAREAGPFAACDIGPTGRLLEPLGDLPFEKAVPVFAHTARCAAEAGADLILIETMSDLYELKAAVLGAREACSLPIFATVTFDASGKLLTGADPAAVCALLEGLGVTALGVNCSLGPEQLGPIVEDLLAHTSLPVIVQPNAGLPRTEGGLVRYDVGPDVFAAAGRTFLQAGARVLGGCCGTTPDHIRALRGVIDAFCERSGDACGTDEREAHTHGAQGPAAEGPAAGSGAGAGPSDGRTAADGLPVPVISSWSRTVRFDGDPVLIGERINPTGKKRFRQALRDRDIDYIVREGLAQEEAGAQVLDVNVGLPDVDEAALMEEAVRALQAVTALPLQLDTSDPRALERGLRAYNGKALINSVNGKAESMAAVFPLVKKYGGVVVALTLDEAGIPDTADGRIAVARRIYETAESYGLSKADILIDPLAMTVSTDSDAALITLETLRRVRDELGGRTILGVSNVSFGLPRRPVIGAAMFTMAMQNGLSAAIIDPLSDEMMKSWYAFRALTGRDGRCQAYVTEFSPAGNGRFAQVSDGPSAGAARTGATASAESAGTPAGPAGSAGTPGLAAAAAGRNAGSASLTLPLAVQKGLAADAARLCREALEAGREPLDVIDRDLIPALTVVGEGFEAKTVFLPGLLMSADAASAAFEEIKKRLSASGETRKAQGRIVLATVKGDIHDIGKNIVKVLLENYGFDVIDLGKDVAPEAVCETVTREKIRLVGLSALMTTTVPAMEETIRLLRAAAPGCLVMVGGAVMTQSYADRIGADFYGKDAMASVRYAQQVFAQ